MIRYDNEYDSLPVLTLQGQQICPSDYTNDRVYNNLAQVAAQNNIQVKNFQTDSIIELGSDEDIFVIGNLEQENSIAYFSYNEDQESQSKQKIGITQKVIKKKKQRGPYTKRTKKQLRQQDTNNICQIVLRKICDGLKKQDIQLYEECFIRDNILQIDDNSDQSKKKIVGNTTVLRRVFMDSRLQRFCIEYLSGTQFIKELAANTRIKSKRIVMKYLGTFIEAAIQPENFDRIKLIK